MCYCQPNVRTPFCPRCQYKMYDDIKTLKGELEIEKSKNRVLESKLEVKNEKI